MTMVAINPMGLPFFATGGLMTPDPGLIIWTALTFLGLLFLLGKTAWKPIVDGLDRRENAIRESLEEAKKAREEALELVERQKSELSAARDEAQKIIERGKAQAGVMRDEIVAKARTEADRTLEAARREIDVQIGQAREDLRREVVGLSVEVAGKVIERSLEDEDHRRLADEFLREVKSH